MAKIHTHNREIDFIEHYKGRNIVIDDGTIMVHDPQWDTLFIVCMDDSKSCGYRTFDESQNTAEAARGYIDWLKN